MPTEADILVVAPATADYLARCAAGRANDLISAVTLAFSGPVVVAPAMNTNMYENPATQRNMETLKTEHSWIFVEPDSGELACGVTGKGRMAPPEVICQSVEQLFNKDLKDITVVITAGPTVEDIDPVRFISNRSSGKTGYALASRAVQRGAEVILISGPVDLPAPSGCKVMQVRSALEMKSAVFSYSDTATAVIMCAAVADYRPANPASEKLKKDNFNNIELTRNPDILAELGNKYKDQPTPVRIGFALETEHLEQNATAKLKSKGAHAIVSNLAKDALEGNQTNVTIFQKSKAPITTGTISKHELADVVLNMLINET